MSQKSFIKPAVLSGKLLLSRMSSCFLSHCSVLTNTPTIMHTHIREISLFQRLRVNYVELFVHGLRGKHVTQFENQGRLTFHHLFQGFFLISCKSSVTAGQEVFTSPELH